MLVRERKKERKKEKDAEKKSQIFKAKNWGKGNFFAACITHPKLGYKANYFPNGFFKLSKLL